MSYTGIATTDRIENQLFKLYNFTWLIADEEQARWARDAVSDIGSYFGSGRGSVEFERTFATASEYKLKTLAKKLAESQDHSANGNIALTKKYLKVKEG